ncbi:class I SAM-dependent methyltransferase [Clavibacter tessellarius]|uniref:class I SAM-dependent methyltransferase n=1 Tax=Clavibacter tessellarius TaxID=31965 RepID=UPI0039E94742
MSNKVRFLVSKSQSDLDQEWDRIAPIRDDQVARLEDATFTRVLEPWVLERANRIGESRVIDVGCGSGRLTSKLGIGGAKVLGIDPSPVSINLARAHDGVSAYEVATAEERAQLHSSTPFDLVVANMVLMDALNLDGIVRSLALLARGGRVLVTIAHPAFWPMYWDYGHDERFDYLQETVVEAPFKTSSQAYGLVSTHIHRPVHRYLECFVEHGLEVTAFQELRGPEDRSAFPYPRFIGIEASVGP